MLEYHLQSLQIVRERAKGGRIRTAQVQRGEKSTSLCRCVEHAPLWALWFLFLNKLLSQKKNTRSSARWPSTHATRVLCGGY